MRIKSPHRQKKRDAKCLEWLTCTGSGGKKSSVTIQPDKAVKHLQATGFENFWRQALKEERSYLLQNPVRLGLYILNPSLGIKKTKQKPLQKENSQKKNIYMRPSKTSFYPTVKTRLHFRSGSSAELQFLSETTYIQGTKKTEWHITQVSSMQASQAQLWPRWFRPRWI